MTVEAIELVRVELRLRSPLRSAHGTETVRRSTLVRVHRADGQDGWGECVALARPTYTEEYADGAYRVLRDLLVPAALSGREVDVVGNPFARSALDAALVDGELRARRENLARWLGATRDRVPTAAVIGRRATVDELVAAVASVVASGVDAVCLKIEPGWDREPLAAVRRGWPSLALAADANGSYRRSDLDLLRGLDDLGLAHLEQPLPARDLVGTAEVARALATPIALDESIRSAEDLEVALAVGAVGAVNVKPARLGGLAATRAVLDLAAGAGLVAWCGGMLEAGIGRAFALAVAALDGCTAPTHLGPTDRYFTRDLTPKVELDAHGCLPVPSGPGIGVTPDPAAVDRLAVHRELIRA